jgi:tripeptidyl-peptidase-1
MRLSFVAALFELIIPAIALPPSPYVTHEKRDLTYSSWAKRDRLSAQDILPLRIGLAQSNLDTGHDLLMDMYI